MQGVCKGKDKNSSPNKHDCVQNYDPKLQSKSMEPAAILYIVTEAPNKRGSIMDWIIADDDTVMQAHMRYHKRHLP